MTAVRIALQALAVARSSEADDHVLAVYLHNLEDLPEDTVCLACERLGKLPREPYQTALPEVGLIRAEAAKVAREWREVEATRKLAPAPQDADPRTWVHCTACSDSSWRHARCDGGTKVYGDRDDHLPRVHCGRRHSHAPHSYVERCVCVDTNPAIARRRQKASAA